MFRLDVELGLEVEYAVVRLRTGELMPLLSANDMPPVLSTGDGDSLTDGSLGDGRGDSPMVDMYCFTSGGREIRDSRERL